MNPLEILLKNIAISTLPEKIEINEILNIPNYHATFKVQIYNNEIYTDIQITEERNVQILNQLRDMLKIYTIPNVIFAYCTQDYCPDDNSYLFTHAKLLHSNTKHIVAPCFTFDYYMEKTEGNNITYVESKKSLYDNSIRYMNDFDIWNNKVDEIVFVGSLTDTNDRINNTNFKNLKEVIPTIIDQSAGSGENFIQREELIKYKYLLHLNGNGGAYSSRLKYLLLSGSLVFYITNFKNNDMLWMEYWMYCPDITENIILVRDVNDCEDAIEYFDKNRMVAYNISRNSYMATHTLLTKENILLYWKILLETYHSIVENNINQQFFFHKFI